MEAWHTVIKLQSLERTIDLYTHGNIPSGGCIIMETRHMGINFRADIIYDNMIYVGLYVHCNTRVGWKVIDWLMMQWLNLTKCGLFFKKQGSLLFFFFLSNQKEHQQYSAIPQKPNKKTNKQNSQQNKTNTGSATERVTTRSCMQEFKWSFSISCVLTPRCLPPCHVLLPECTMKASNHTAPFSVLTSPSHLKWLLVL